MLSFNLPDLLVIARELGRIVYMDADGDQPLTTFVRQNHIEAFTDHGILFDRLGLGMCKLQTNRICRELEREDSTVSDLKFFLAELHNRILDECSTRYYLALSDEEKRFFEPPRPLFGMEIEDKIPSVIEDIAEAGKCLGLGRSTAAVFHLMRVMETGVQRLGASLDIELTETKVWQVILDQINKKIAEQGRAAPRYAAITAHLYNVKLAWRNEVMHPKATYTVEEAQGIFEAVKVFANDLVKVI